MAVTQTLSVTEVDGSIDYEANTSKVRIRWLSTQTGESWNGYTKTAYYFVSVNGGAETTYSVRYTLPQNTAQLILDTTITVPHNTDGTCTVAVRTWMDTEISAGVVEKSNTITITPIKRATIIDSLSCNTQFFTGGVVVSCTPRSTDLWDKISYDLIIDGICTNVKEVSFGNSDILAQYTYRNNFTKNELATIYNKLTNSSKGTLRVTVRSYSNLWGTQVGSESYKEITLNIPNDETTQPTVSMSLSPSSDLPSPYNSLYLQGFSKVKADLSSTTKYGATVVASSITVNGNTYASPYETDNLTQAGKVSVKATVKDSRGFYGTYYKEIEVIPYSKPYVTAKSGESNIIASRCDSSANFTDSGTSLKIKAKAVFSKVVSNGVQNNYGFIKYRWRKEGGTYSAWETILDCKANNSDEVITPPLLNGALDIKSNYQVQIIVSDDFYDSVPITIAVPSDAVYMDRPKGGKSMGLGGYSSGDGNLDVHWKTKARGGLSLFDSKGDEIPLGTTMPLPRDQIKGSWNPNDLECGIHVVSGNCDALKAGDSVIMSNGVLIHMVGSVSGNVKIQIALPVDTNRSPMYRICWYNNWAGWRSLKL